MEVSLNSPPNCILNEYLINAIQVLSRKDTGGKDSLDVNCCLSRHKDDAEQYLIRLDVSYKAKTKTEFTVQISVDGYFSWRGGLEVKEGDGYMAWVNGGTILYGIVRATVADLTSSCKCGRVILPTIMMEDIVKDEIRKAIERTTKTEGEIKA